MIVNTTTAGGCTPVRLEIRELMLPEHEHLKNMYILGLKNMEAQFVTDSHSWHQLQGPEFCVSRSNLFPIMNRAHVALFEQILLDNVKEVVQTFQEPLKTTYAKLLPTFRAPYIDLALPGPPPRIVYGSEKVVVASAPYGIPELILNPLLKYGPHPGEHNDMESLAERLPARLRDMFQVAHFDEFATSSSAPGDPSVWESLESIHDSVERVIGGRTNTCDKPTGFNPLSWLHRCNTDRLFAMWQAVHPGVYIENDLDIALHPFSKREGKPLSSKDVRDHTTFNSTYSELAVAPLEPADDMAEHVHASIQRLYGPYVQSGELVVKEPDTKAAGRKAKTAAEAAARKARAAAGEAEAAAREAEAAARVTREAAARRKEAEEREGEAEALEEQAKARQEEAEARNMEAEARVGEAEARVVEAEARVTEAEARAAGVAEGNATTCAERAAKEAGGAADRAKNAAKDAAEKAKDAAKEVANKPDNTAIAVQGAANAAGKAAAAARESEARALEAEAAARAAEAETRVAEAATLVSAAKKQVDETKARAQGLAELAANLTEQAAKAAEKAANAAVLAARQAFRAANGVVGLVTAAELSAGPAWRAANGAVQVAIAVAPQANAAAWTADASLRAASRALQVTISLGESPAQTTYQDQIDKAENEGNWKLIEAWKQLKHLSERRREATTRRDKARLDLVSAQTDLAKAKQRETDANQRGGPEEKKAREGQSRAAERRVKAAEREVELAEAELALVQARSDIAAAEARLTRADTPENQEGLRWAKAIQKLRSTQKEMIELRHELEDEAAERIALFWFGARRNSRGYKYQVLLKLVKSILPRLDTLLNDPPALVDLEREADKLENQSNTITLMRGLMTMLMDELELGDATGPRETMVNQMWDLLYLLQQIMRGRGKEALERSKGNTDNEDMYGRIWRRLYEDFKGQYKDLMYRLHKLGRLDQHGCCMPRPKDPLSTAAKTSLAPAAGRGFPIMFNANLDSEWTLSDLASSADVDRPLHYKYQAHVSVQRSIPMCSTASVRFSMGSCAPSKEQQYLAGSFGIDNTDRDKGEGGAADETTTVAGSIPLNLALLECVKNGGLKSFAPEHVICFLAEHLSWTADFPGIKTGEELKQGLKVGVSYVVAEIPYSDRELPKYSLPEILYDVTEGRTYGIGMGEEV